MRDSNGILASIPAGGITPDPHTLLPNPTTAEDRPYVVVVDVDHIGRVRMFYRRAKVRHRKHSHWYWAAFRAEKADADEPISPVISETPYSPY